MTKRPEHPKMQGKSNEEILADAKELIDDMQLHAEDDSGIVWVGSEQYTGRQFYEKVTSLGTFGREWISNYYYMLQYSTEYKIKKIKNILKFYWGIFTILVLANIMLLFNEHLMKEGSLWYWLTLSVSASMIAMIILIGNKNKELDDLSDEMICNPK